MKVQILVETDSNGNELVKARGWFYSMNKETGKVELNEDGTKKTVKSNKIVASVNIPNSIGNRGTYVKTTVTDGVASNFACEVQLKSKYFNDISGQWIFKIEKWNKEMPLQEYFIGDSDGFECDCKLELKDKEFYVGYVNKHGFFVVTEKYDKTKVKSKRDDNIQQ